MHFRDPRKTKAVIRVAGKTAHPPQGMHTGSPEACFETAQIKTVNSPRIPRIRLSKHKILTSASIFSLVCFQEEEEKLVEPAVGSTRVRNETYQSDVFSPPESTGEPILCTDWLQRAALPSLLRAGPLGRSLRVSSSSLSYAFSSKEVN